MNLSETKVDFGDRYTFPRHAVTSYKSQKGANENYRLDAVLFFLKYRKLGNVQQSSKENYGPYMKSVCLNYSDLIDSSRRDVYSASPTCSTYRVQIAPASMGCFRA